MEIWSSDPQLRRSRIVHASNCAEHKEDFFKA